ncbi:M48 family metalloprotease [Melittangium boletus]|uniref:Protease n=1 Tax=Melittangium boletus DSM 14713 TaxID=1294270 RepID=A0A250IAG1_9BACT|nr:M48 family metalloprotease [Melittangium boletus]ATB28117.1 protease [Melittangium boletus DSM 14713]
MWTLTTLALFTVSFLGLAGLVGWLSTRMDSFVVALHGARRLHFEEAPWLHELMAHLSIAAGIPSPPLYVVRRPRPNAFSCGLGSRSSRIMLTSAALEELDEAELRAMLAHELAHIAHGHTRRATLVAVLAAVLMRVGAKCGGRARTLDARGAAIARRVLTRLHRLGTPPERDLIADRTAAGLLGDALGLAALLARLKERATWGELVSLSEVGTPFTAPSLEGRSLDERIHQLRRMAAEEQARRAKALILRSLRRGPRFYPRVGATRRRSASSRPPPFARHDLARQASA